MRKMNSHKIMQYIRYVLELINLYLGFIYKNFSIQFLNQNKTTRYEKDYR